MVADKKKISDVVNSLEYEELVNLQRDLLNGASSLKQVVSNKIKEISTLELRTCSTCGNSINLRMENELTLIFGPVDVKKRLSFCAIDCMEYFTTNLKRLTEKKIPQNIS